MKIKVLKKNEIENWLKVKRDDIPKYLILDCAWPVWRSKKDAKLYIKNPKSLGIGKNFWVGNHPKLKIKVGYAFSYGAPMTALTLHLLVKLGVKLVYQIGSIGALQDYIKLSDLIIPSSCLKLDGLSNYYLPGNFIKVDSLLLKSAIQTLNEFNFTNYHVGKIVSVISSLIETKERIKKWQREGFLGIDLETSLVHSICKSLKARAITILRVSNTQKQGERIVDKRRHSKDKKRKRAKRLIRDLVIKMIEKEANNF